MFALLCFVMFGLFAVLEFASWCVTCFRLLLMVGLLMLFYLRLSFVLGCLIVLFALD